MSGEHLDPSNWPDCIPWTGPVEKYGVTPWAEPDHDPDEIDEYPYSHPDAASIGDVYMGDVCPQCGVPLRFDEIVKTIHGKRGMLWEVSPNDDPVPSYHPECHAKRQGYLSTSLFDFEVER